MGRADRDPDTASAAASGDEERETIEGRILPDSPLVEHLMRDRPDEASRITAIASVVLPDPLSPTIPSVSPARTLMVASFTALMWPVVRRRNPR